MDTLPHFDTQGNANGLDLLILQPKGFRRFRLPETGVVSIGRALSADVIIEDPSVSRHHAEIRIGPTIELRDLNSTNGTYLGGKRLERDDAETIRPGDVLEVGHVTLIIRSRDSEGVSDGENAPQGTALKDCKAARTPSRGRPVVVSDAMHRIYDLLGRAAKSSINVLILGPTGSGKEVLAQHLHDLSPRAKRRLVKLNCAALPAPLLESELFGYSKGAFSGALNDKPGLIETASQGTLMLDEIGDMPVALQAKLLRAIDAQSVRRVGALTSTQVDVRYVATTHRPLSQLMAQGEFREDLYYRLGGVVVEVPPLCSRQEEILPLTARFVEAATETVGLDEAPALSRAATTKLLKHVWPGNVRELKSVIERAVLLCRGNTIEADDIHLDHYSQSVAAEQGRLDRATESRDSLESAVTNTEKQALIDALEACNGDRSRAARFLGISQRTLYRRLAQHNMSRRMTIRAPKKRSDPGP